MFFDSHCHLTSEVLASQLPEVLQRAGQAKVTRMLNISDTIQSSQQALEQIPLALNYGIEMFATAGIHPQQALEFSLSETPNTLREIARHPKIVAIGEIGLDYMYDDSHPQYPGAPRAYQEQVLRSQLKLAQELDLPVVIHNREADEDLLRVLSDYPQLRGVFHCITSPPAIAKRVLELGFFLGFTGIVTFKNAETIRDVVKLCPLDRMLIETDAPYLAPVPHRGKTNEPSYVPQVAQCIADLTGQTQDSIGQLTTQNANRLFALA